ncbi:phosphatase 1 regulatory subunit 7-like protein [Drosera capensis]
MARLTTDLVLKENQAAEAEAVTAVTLTHRALSNVSCLGNFRNVERIDLGFNNLRSLEGLALCVNLKWLSVVENKLESLKGVEGLTKLTVLKAAKNKLRSMDEVENLVKLQALILNDNEITSICNLDKMKDLNTLVLSRNPVRKIGESLARLKSISKISLANCELEGIDSSIKGCVELKELRLGHNEIKTLPEELAHASNLQHLDLGNNFIKSWSALKVLSSLQRLKSLNLHGNSVAEKDKLVSKVKKLVPGLKIYNSKPIEKFSKHWSDDLESNSLTGDKETKHKKKEKGSAYAKTKSEITDAKSTKSDNGSEHWGERKQKKSEKHTYKNGMHGEDDKLDRKKLRSKTRNAEESGVISINQNESKHEEKSDRSDKTKNHTKSSLNQSEHDDIHNSGDDEEKGKKKKKQQQKKTKESAKTETEKTTEKKSKKRKTDLSVLDIIDDRETPFSELLALDVPDAQNDIGEEKDDKGLRGSDAVNPVVITAKRRKAKKPGQIISALELLSPAVEVGLGGPSAWVRLELRGIDDDEEE